MSVDNRWRITCESADQESNVVAARRVRVFHGEHELTSIRRVIADFEVGNVAVVHLEVLASDIRVDANLLAVVNKLEGQGAVIDAPMRHGGFLCFTDAETGDERAIPVAHVKDMRRGDDWARGQVPSGANTVIEMRLADGDGSILFAREGLRDLVRRS